MNEFKDKAGVRHQVWDIDDGHDFVVAPTLLAALQVYHEMYSGDQDSEIEGAVAAEPGLVRRFKILGYDGEQMKDAEGRLMTLETEAQRYVLAGMSPRHLASTDL